MFAKGNLHGDGGKLIDYIMSAGPGENVEFGGSRGFDFFSEDPREAARLMQRMAQVITNAEKPWFHTQTRLPADERLTLNRWEEVVDREEKRLGFTGLPRLWTFHIKPNGERHLHVAWYRVDVETERTIDPGLFKLRLKDLCRTMERDFGLREITNSRKPSDIAKSANRNEVEESRRLGTDVREIRAAILDNLQRADSGKAFKAALEAQGFELANGDRRNVFMVIDPAGGMHALNKRLTGMTLAETGKRLADIDRSKLPSVEEAQDWQAGRRAVREAAEKAKHPGRHGDAAKSEPPKIKPLGKTAGEIRMAWNVTRQRDAAALVEDLANRKLTLVYVGADEARRSERAKDFAKAIGRSNRALKEGFAVVDRRGAITRIDQRVTGDLWEEIQKRFGGIDRSALMTVAEARAAQSEANRAEFRAKKEAERAEERRKAPAGKIAGEIRDAWMRSRDAAPARDIEKLNEALAERGMTMARVTAEEAYQSERTAAFAREIGNRAPVFKDGEIVVVNSFGSVYRLDERTTGNRRDEIDNRLAGVDPDVLLSVADTKDAMRDAARAANAEARRDAEQKARAPTAIERNIMDCERQARISGAIVQQDQDGATVSRIAAVADRLKPDEERRTESVTIGGPQAFAALLAEAGIAIVRVTEADMKALDALRVDEDLAWLAADVNGQARRSQRFDQVELGQIAAIDRFGNVHALNPHKIDLAALERHVLEGAEKPANGDALRLASIIEARAAFELDREQTGQLWQQHREDYQARRVALSESRDAMREVRAAVHTVQDAKQGIVDAGEEAVDQAFTAGRKLAESAFKIIHAGFSILFGFAMAPPKMTAAQVETAERVHEEKTRDQADAAHAAAVEGVREWQAHSLKTQQQEKDLRLAQTLGTNPTAEANRGRDEYDRHRERERDRF